MVISLQVGRANRLPASGYVSDNGRVVVEGDHCMALYDVRNPYGRFTLTRGGHSINGTIVPWKTTGAQLVLEEWMPDYPLLQHDDWTYFRKPDGNLYRTQDSFETEELVGPFPGISHRYFLTPKGWIVRGVNRIIHSDDMVTWETVGETTHYGLYHGTDVWYDESTDTLRVYTGEYSTDPNHRHKVFRGTKAGDDPWRWDVILDFASPIEAANDPNISLFCRHVHVTIVDPYTGDVWVGTGDGGDQIRIMRSQDYGETWQTVGMGTQEWRCLSIWFTERYVYWNMDTDVTQKVFRVARSNLDDQSPSTDYREIVAVLDNGSHWYHCYIQDHRGNPAVIMGACAEGENRDQNARLFLIRELPSGATRVEEVYLIASDPETYFPFLQLEPKVQDVNGYIYFKGRSLPHNGLWKMRLEPPAMRRPVIDNGARPFRSQYTLRSDVAFRDDPFY